MSSWALTWSLPAATAICQHHTALSHVLGAFSSLSRDESTVRTPHVQGRTMKRVYKGQITPHGGLCLWQAAGTQGT